MRNMKLVTITIGITLFITSGCAMNRANITELSKKQGEYYVELKTMLQNKKPLMESALTAQLQADKKLELNLLDWKRDLRKAEVLLQVDADVKGNKELLSRKLAEINLEEVIDLSNLQIEESRKDVILQLYDKLNKAVEDLEKNNKTIVEYLSSANAKFAIQTLDVDGIVRTISAIRSLQEELGQIEKKSEEERKKEAEKIQKTIERARDVLIKGFKKVS